MIAVDLLFDEGSTGTGAGVGVGVGTGVGVGVLGAEVVAGTESGVVVCLRDRLADCGF